jgi:hypothetical protein
MFPPEITQQLIDRGTDGLLIVDLIAAARPASEILERHNLTEDMLRQKLKNPMFRTMYKEVKKFWNSDMNVHERIRFKSAMLTEELLPTIFQIAQRDSTGDSNKLEAFKQLGGMGKPKDTGNQMGVQFNLTINKGPTEKVEINGRRIIDAASEPA